MVSTASLSYAASSSALYLVAHSSRASTVPHADPYLLPMAALLTAIGVTEIYRLKPADAFRQALWIVIGVALFAATLLVLRRDYRVLEPLQVPLRPRRDRAARPPGAAGDRPTVNGAQLWVQVGPLQFQPGELAKMLLIVFLAAYLREKREVLAQGRLKDLGPLLLIWGGAMLVLVQTNDLGSALLYFGIFLAMLYVATGRLSYVARRARALRRRRVRRVPGRPARRDRISIWLDPWARRAGRGLPARAVALLDRERRLRRHRASARGRSRRPTARSSIPYLNTDFIYSALAQELGLVGAVALLLVYMLFVVRGFRTRSSPTTASRSCSPPGSRSASRCRRSSSSAASCG